MYWIILFSHAFNPFFVLLLINMSENHGDNYSIQSPSNIIAGLISAFGVYLLWVGLHFLLTMISNFDFKFDDLIGINQSMNYFLPFILGALILLNESLIRPLLRSTQILAVNKSLITLSAFIGMYFMLINYINWLFPSN